MARARCRTPEEVAWIMENVPKMTTADARDAFLERFGWVTTYQGWMVWNAKHGISPLKGRPVARTRCERTVKWTEEHEMDAWMCEHDQGQPRADIIDEFEREFGFRLTGEQVSANRQLHERQVKRQKPGGRQWDVPVGTEVVRKGYVWVKVSMWPEKKGTKDNWMPKSIVEYERLNGKVPDGCNVVFADGDQTNFDPKNLVAVPKKLIGIMNSLGGWSTREELESVMALAKLKLAIGDVENGDRTCWRCGRTFRPSYRTAGSESVRTCPRCVAEGHKAPPRLTGKAGIRACSVCGELFTADKVSQRRCRKCIDAMPKGNIKAQRSRYERTGRR